MYKRWKLLSGYQKLSLINMGDKELIEICKKVLDRLTKIGCENESMVSSGQLIFPTKNNVKRISEQELRQLFIEEFKSLQMELFFSIETPTIGKYSFTNKAKKLKVADKDDNGQSALLDMSIFNKNFSSYERFLNIEFKHKNTTHNNISKDILKLVHEKQSGVFILLLKNTNRGTLKSVHKKISDSFVEHKDKWKGNEYKYVDIVILTLEEKRNNNGKPFVKHIKISKNDLDFIETRILNG